MEVDLNKGSSHQKRAKRMEWKLKDSEWINTRYYSLFNFFKIFVNRLTKTVNKKEEGSKRGEWSQV